jgi:hypothetical protein
VPAPVLRVMSHAGPPEEPEQTPADLQQEPTNQQGCASERKLQRYADQEAGLQGGVEREALGVQQPLDQFLRAIGDLRGGVSDQPW